MTKRIAIIPFEQNTDQLSFLSQSIQDMLIRELALSQKYVVISKQSIRVAADKSDDNTEIGKQLNVNRLLKGNIIEDNGLSVHIYYHRLDLNETEHTEIKVAKENIFTLGDRCLSAVLKLLRIKDEKYSPVAIPKLTNPELYQKFLLGNYHFNRWTQENVAEAIALFKQVIEKEPNFAPAYLRLAKCYIFQAGRGHEAPDSVYPKARKIIDKALELNPNSGEALIDKNLIDFFYDLDWRNIYTSIEEGLEKYVDASEAYQQLSFFWYGLKEYDAALDALYSALEFDPLSTGVLNMIGDVQLSAKRYDDSERTFQSILKMVPNDPASLENLLYIASLRGNEQLASKYLRKLQRVLTNDTPFVPRMGYFYGKFRHDREAQEFIAHFEAMEKQYPNRVLHNYKAQVYSGIGDWERVMNFIEQGWKARTGILFILTDPQLEPLHKWKRYQLMISQVWLPEKIEDIDYISLNTDIKETVRVNLKALLFIKAEDNYTRLYFFQNFRLEQKLLRATLKKIALQLPNNFVRVHRTYIINSTHDYEVFGNSKTRYITQPQHDIEIPVSRSFDPAILASSTFKKS